MNQPHVRQIVCPACGQTNVRYQGGWRGFWLRPESPYLCTFCRADLDDGKLFWFLWPTRILLMSIYYFGHALIFVGIWVLFLAAVDLITDNFGTPTRFAIIVRTISVVVAAALGLIVCELRRRKGTLLGGTSESARRES